MNKRQAKKVYKKKYGHNPPKQPYGAREFLEWVTYVVDGIQAGIQAAVDNVTEVIGATRERIRTMPEEEFNKLIESAYLEDGTKRLAWKIRMNEGSTENGERGVQHIASDDSAADEGEGTGDYTGNGEKRTG